MPATKPTRFHLPGKNWPQWEVLPAPIFYGEGPKQELHYYRNNRDRQKRIKTGYSGSMVTAKRIGPINLNRFIKAHGLVPLEEPADD